MHEVNGDAEPISPPTVRSLLPFASTFRQILIEAGLVNVVEVGLSRRSDVECGQEGRQAKDNFLQTKNKNI